MTLGVFRLHANENTRFSTHDGRDLSHGIRAAFEDNTFVAIKERSKCRGCGKTLAIFRFNAELWEMAILNSHIRAKTSERRFVKTVTP